MRRDWYWLEDDGSMTRMKDMPRWRIRSLYPRPFLHEETTTSMWMMILSCLLAAIVICGDWQPGRAILGWACLAVVIAALIQWLWWGRRSGNR